jgi:phage shock protein A
MTRITRIFKADIHGVMDQLEDQGLLLKQHLREMEEALHRHDAELKKKMLLRKQAQLEYDNYRQQCDALEQDLTAAIEKNRDEIARMLIKKVKPIEELSAEFKRRIGTLNEDINRFENHLNQQRLRYEQLKQRSVIYFQKTRMQAWETDRVGMVSDAKCGQLSEEEIEWELLKRKAALGAEQ